MEEFTIVRQLIRVGTSASEYKSATSILLAMTTGGKRQFKPLSDKSLDGNEIENDEESVNILPVNDEPETPDGHPARRLVKKRYILYFVTGVCLITMTMTLLFSVARMHPWYGCQPQRFVPLPDTVTVLDTVTFGSCAMQSLPHPFWDTMANLRPNLFIFGGDNVYGDNNGGAWMPACSDSSCQVLKEAYHELEKKPSFTGFRAKYPILAVWDDHDFGVNDGGASFPYKRNSMAIFKKFFEIDDKRNKDPRRGRDGVYGAWWYGVDTRRVHIVVLDCRFFKSNWALRDPKKTYSKKGSYLPSTSSEKTMLGEVQWSWFEQELSQRSEVCLIVSSIQVISTATEYENWGLFPNERLRVLNMLENSACGAVLILSGDRHVGGIYRSGTLVEVTSSSLTHTMKYISEIDPTRLHPLVEVNNFGALSFHWEQKTVVATLREGEGRHAGSVIQTVNITFR